MLHGLSQASQTSFDWLESYIEKRMTLAQCVSRSRVARQPLGNEFVPSLAVQWLLRRNLNTSGLQKTARAYDSEEWAGFRIANLYGPRDIAFLGTVSGSPL